MMLEPPSLLVMASNKLRILCLHGYTQNGIMFRKKTAAARKSLEGIADLIYITAPHHISPPTFGISERQQQEEEEEISEEHKPYGWWYSPKYKPTKDNFFIGFKESVEYIKQVLIKEGPFDGILGFSQGGCFAALLTHMLQDRNYFPDLIPPSFNHAPFQFSIIVAGFKPTMQEATNIMLTKQNKVKTPSLHYIGELDTLVLPEAMNSLSEAFVKPTVFRHSGGHYLPSTAASCKALAKFVSHFTPITSQDKQSQHLLI
ncbi:serine hydrolase FSH [Gilbertella persicaria]|uniref:serine hydrolase FSH n=1 Tax=Gilbertella persicaria TaxID=101096 RepID=UPI00221EEED1|nr:serine hydrolase FSH [Gilbertella persicaria]KAI8098236.1 serine hydrolase FSH [Gilbertella persicaria]